MKTKNITITYRIRPANADVLTGFLDEYQDGNEELICINVEDADTGKMAAVYENEYGEVKAYFNDTQFCDSLMEYSIKCISEGKGFYLCYPKIKDIRSGEKKLLIDLEIEMPWYVEKVPSVPEVSLQEYKPVCCNSQTMHLQSRITGIKHCLSNTQYEKLEESVSHRETIRLSREPENPYDSNAIAAYTNDGLKIGYIAREETSLINGLMQEPDFTATLCYMDFMAGSASIEITVSAQSSIYAQRLFSKYTPLEVCKANYLYRRWGGIPEKEEAGIFSSETLTMDFDRFSQLELMYQDRLAQEWEERMAKATVENPDTPGARMNVPLDLSVYGTNWEKLDLNNSNLIDLIEMENKVVAIYIRMRRNGYKGTPDDFNNDIADGEIKGSAMQRIQDIFIKKRL